MWPATKPVTLDCNALDFWASHCGPFWLRSHVYLRPEDDAGFIGDVTGRFERENEKIEVCPATGRSFCVEDTCGKRQCHDMLLGRTDRFENGTSDWACDCYGSECFDYSSGLTLTVKIIENGNARIARAVAATTGVRNDVAEEASGNSTTLRIVPYNNPDSGSRAVIVFGRETPRDLSEWKQTATAKNVCAN